MAFKIGGTPVQAITIGGKTCTDIMMGSTHVWCTPPLPQYYNVIKMGLNGKYTYAIDFYIVNTSNITVTYKITYGNTTKTVSISKKAAGMASFDVALAPVTTKSVKATVEYLGYSTFITNNYNQTIARA